MLCNVIRLLLSVQRYKYKMILSEKNFTDKYIMRRKSCIFAAKFAENNMDISRTTMMEYVYLGAQKLATIQVG